MRPDKATLAIKAAIDLFGEQGFDNTSTQSIAKHAGIGNATLFKYFTSKDLLIREAYLATKKEIIRAIKEGLTSDLSFEELIRAVWLNYLEWALENPNKYSFARQIHSSRFYDPAVEEYLDRELLFFKMAVKSAQEKDEMANVPFELAQATMMSFLNLAIDFHKMESPIKEIEIYQLMLNSLQILSTKPTKKVKQ